MGSEEGLPLRFEVGQSAPTDFAGRAIVPALLRQLDVAVAAACAARLTIIFRADALMVQGPPAPER